MGTHAACSLHGWFACARSHRSAQQHRLQVGIAEGHKRAWETRFHELVQYKAKHGDCDVSTKQGKLGTWVGTQRESLQGGSLAQDRIDRLNSIGFKWTSHGVRQSAVGDSISTSSSNTRQSTATATFQSSKESLESGLINKGLLTRRASYRRTALIGSMALASTGRRQEEVQG